MRFVAHSLLLRHTGHRDVRTVAGTGGVMTGEQSGHCSGSTGRPPPPWPRPLISSISKLLRIRAFPALEWAPILFTPAPITLCGSRLGVPSPLTVTKSPSARIVSRQSARQRTKNYRLQRQAAARLWTFSEIIRTFSDRKSHFEVRGRFSAGISHFEFFQRFHVRGTAESPLTD